MWSPYRSSVSALLVLAASTLVGCAAPPIPADVRSVLASPSSFDGTRVEITAPVASNELSSNGHAVWRLRIGTPPDDLLAYEEGTNVGIIKDCAALADRAGRERLPVTVTGIVREGPHEEHVSGLRLDMETFRFGGETIDTDYRDWDGGWY